MTVLSASEQTRTAVRMWIGAAQLDIAPGTDPQWLGALRRALAPGRV